MTYDYNVYHRQNCIVPLISASFLLFLCIGSFVSLLKNVGGRPKTIIEKLEIPAMLSILVFLLMINLVILFRGGIYLLWEKKTDQIQVSGKIEDTMEIDFLTGAKYGTENNNGRGEIIVVNGKKYYLTTYGDFDVGDDVVLNVLPRSGFVLKMERANETSTD